MPKPIFIGEFEHLILLTLLHLGEEGYALAIRDRLSTTAGRTIARGALYRTLDRLDGKGLVRWELEDQVPGRGGHVRRRYLVTPRGVAALRASRQALVHLWAGLEAFLP